LNLVNTATSLLVANELSKNVAGLPLKDFLLAGTQFSDTNQYGMTVSGDPFNNIITLSEIFKGNQGSSTRPPVGETLFNNAKKNIANIAIAAVAIPVGAKVLTSLLRKPVLTPMNRMLKMTGLEVKV